MRQRSEQKGRYSFSAAQATGVLHDGHSIIGVPDVVRSVGMCGCHGEVLFVQCLYDVIVNDGSLQQLDDAVQALHEQYLTMAAAHAN